MTDAQPERRREDQSITRLAADLQELHNCVEGLKQDMVGIKSVVEDVREILAAFRLTGKVAKWVSAAVASAGGVIAGLIAAWDSLRGLIK